MFKPEEKNNVGAEYVSNLPVHTEKKQMPTEACRSAFYFDVEAVNEFFCKEINPQAFAKRIRLYIRESSLVYMENPNDIPNDVATTIAILDSFAERLDPYFTKLDY